MLICCNDFNANFPERSGISISDIVGLIGRRSPESIFIFDCCRAPLTGRTNHQPLWRRPMITVSDSTLVVLSCSEKQYSYEDNAVNGGVGAGVFSHYLVEAIKSHCTNATGTKVWFSKMFDEAKRSTEAYVRARGARQTPITLGPPLDRFRIHA
jgi:hypothetical protein